MAAMPSILNLEFTAVTLPCDGRTVVYGGPEGGLESNAFTFGLYVPLTAKAAFWVSAAAVDLDVVARLQGMKIGQSFRIAADDWTGDLRMVRKIEEGEDMPAYPVLLAQPLDFKKLLAIKSL